MDSHLKDAPESWLAYVATDRIYSPALFVAIAKLFARLFAADSPLSRLSCGNYDDEPKPYKWSIQADFHTLFRRHLNGVMDRLFIDGRRVEHPTSYKETEKCLNTLTLLVQHCPIDSTISDEEIVDSSPPVASEERGLESRIRYGHPIDVKQFVLENRLVRPCVVCCVCCLCVLCVLRRATSPCTTADLLPCLLP